MTLINVVEEYVPGPGESLADPALLNPRSNYIAPISVTWYITKVCNLQCTHCYVYEDGEAPIKRKNELTYEQAIAVADQLIEAGVFSLAFCGGEVLSVKWFADLLEYCASHGIQTSFSSNGALLTPDLAKRFKAANLIGMQLSLDGGTEETHDTVRGKGNFKQVMEAAELCVEHDIPAQFAFTLTAKNHHEIDDLLQAALDAKVSSLKLQMFIPMGRSVGELALICDKERYWEIIMQLKAFSREHGLHIVYPCFMGNIDHINQIDWLPNVYPDELSCGAGTNRAIIFEDGSIGACDFMPHDRAGNLNNESFMDIWNGGHEVIDRWRRIEKVSGTCGDCGYKSKCGYGCRAYAEYVSGDFYGWDSSCLTAMAIGGGPGAAIASDALNQTGDSAIKQIATLHNQGSHSSMRSIREPEKEHWNFQLSPIREFYHAPVITLPPPHDRQAPLYRDLGQPASAQALTESSLSQLLYLAFGVTEIKEYGGRRVEFYANPSSGNLRSAEVYVVIPHHLSQRIRAGVYHYQPHTHQLTQRCRFTAETAASSIYIGLSSIPERQCWRYGDRGFRYAQLDIGHAYAAAGYAALSLSWHTQLADLSDSDLATLMGTSRRQDFQHDSIIESAAALIEVQWQTSDVDTPTDLVAKARTGEWLGEAKKLREENFLWQQARDLMITTRRKSEADTAPAAVPATAVQSLQPPSDSTLSFDQVAFSRRSATAFNGQNTLPVAVFLKMLARAFSAKDQIYHTQNRPSATQHLVLFVHSVEGLIPGMYLYAGNGGDIEVLRGELFEGFLWQQVADSLYLLEAGNPRESCSVLFSEQAVGTTGAFTCMVLSEFENYLEDHGSAAYRDVYWQAGALVHSLYLEATSLQLGASGIGAFYDREIQNLLGVKGWQYKVLYAAGVGYQ